MNHNVQQVKGQGHEMGWSTVMRDLNVAGIELQGPRRIYREMLFEKKDEITEALEKEKGQQEVQQIVQEVLREWRRKVGIEQAKEVEHMLGLTPEERGIERSLRRSPEDV